MKQLKIFVDMDGTIAEWRKSAKFEDLYKKNYFLSLKPHQNLIDALLELNKESNVSIYVLSAYLIDSKYALKEKNKWLDKHFNIPRTSRLFLPCGENKNIYCEKNNCLLIDDYNLNLNSWNGLKIKAVNNVNDVKGSFDGPRINVFDTKENIIKQIKSLL